MQHWSETTMLAAGRQQFEKLVTKNRLAQPNHDIHFLAREKNDWLRAGCQSLISGTYTPYFIKRRHFKDETVDSLTIPDRILQSLVLKQLKTTFKQAINPHCYHMEGPNGVKRATQRIKEYLDNHKPRYVIRADIRGYYHSIPHLKLIHTIKRNYDDPRLHQILEAIIRNPIETPCGYRNPDSGIPIRGPLSTFFSALYLKPLDEAFANTQVSYFRYQDDILILCQSKRQYQRSRRRLAMVLQERRLCLSRKKTRRGLIEKGFHFLGIDYFGTQTQDKSEAPAMKWRLHRRTVRKAQEQVNQMVADGFSARQIRDYWVRWARWWTPVASNGGRATVDAVPGLCLVSRRGSSSSSVLFLSHDSGSWKSLPLLLTLVARKFLRRAFDRIPVQAAGAAFTDGYLSVFPEGCGVCCAFDGQCGMCDRSSYSVPKHCGIIPRYPVY